jgi:hypothetical protein
VTVAVAAGHSADRPRGSGGEPASSAGPGPPGGTAPGATVGDRVRSAWPWAAILLAVLAGAALAGHAKPTGPPLGPSATSPDGAKALRLLLEQQGAIVDVGPRPSLGSSDGIALVLQDQLNADGRATLLAWVQRGGTLVIADPRSELAGAAPSRAPGAGGIEAARSPLAPACPEPAVAGVDQIDPAGSPLLRATAGHVVCFPQAGGAYLLMRKQGQGAVVALGGPRPWTNAYLGKLDNSVLAAALLAPTPGGRLSWFDGTLAGGGHRSLVDLIPGRVEAALAQVGVALVVLALWRGRRLGRPVLERQPVELPGSELVVAVGNLLHQGHRIDQATSVLRYELGRGLADRLGVPAAAGPGVLADAAAAKSGLDRSMVLATLAGLPPADEAGLVALAQAADAIRQEVIHAH